MTDPQTGKGPIDAMAATETPAAGRGALPAMQTSTAAEQVPVDIAAGSRAKRLLSLDALRGLTIAFMILVNNNGGPGSWRQLNHADWNGFTATDLVFPTFLFVVGVSIVFAFEARLARGATRMQIARHTLVRAGMLLLFGLAIPLAYRLVRMNFDHFRFYGVLQRIALCYAVVGLFYLWDRRVSTKVAVLVVALVGYWVLVRWVPVPGAGMPGRDVVLLDRNQNIVAWVDRHLMPGHLYEDWPLHNARDPEGLLSTIPAIGTTLIGLIAGIWLRARRSMTPKTTALKTAGLVVGSLLCLGLGFVWSHWLPLNKKMWTSSYVLVAAGWSLAIFALFYWAMEHKGWCRTGWSRGLVWPWLVFGSNAITAYVISDLLPLPLENIRFHWDGIMMNPMGWSQLRIFSRIPDPGWATFAFALAYTLVCFVPIWLMYRKKIFLKL